MDIQDLVEEGGNLEGWVTYKGSFEIKLRYIPKETLQDIRRKCTKLVYHKHQPVEDIDEDKLHEALIKYILDWRGLSRNGSDVGCTDENKLILLKKSYNFDEFIFQALTDIETIRKSQLEFELKNSETLSP